MFPCGSTLFINFPDKNVKNITEIDVSIGTFPRKGVFISPYMRTFPKGDSPRPLSATEIIGNYLPVSQMSQHISQKSSV